MKIGEKIKELREDKQLSQYQVAQALELPRYILSNIEQGRTEPNLDYLVKLADFFGCTTDELLGREPHSGAVDKRKELRPSTLKLVDATEKLNDMGIAVVLGYVARLIEENPDFVLPQFRARA